MARLSLPLATAAIVAVALVGARIIAGGGGVSQAQGNGDLLLDWAIDDNTPTAVGEVDTGCQSFSAGTLVQIDAVAVNAVDWAAMDFVIEYPSPAVVTRPGRGDGQGGGAYDFVPSDPGDPTNTFGAQNFMFPDSSDTNADYSTTEPVPDGSSPHGMSPFDNSLAGNSGSGGMARITLDTTGLTPGVYTLSLGVTAAFAGGVHSDASGLELSGLGSVQLAIDTDCPAGTPMATQPQASPTPAASPGPPSPNDGDSDDDNSWLTIVFVAGGAIAAVAVIAAVSGRLMRRVTRK